MSATSDMSPQDAELGALLDEEEGVDPDLLSEWAISAERLLGLMDEGNYCNSLTLLQEEVTTADYGSILFIRGYDGWVHRRLARVLLNAGGHGEVMIYGRRIDGLVGVLSEVVPSECACGGGKPTGDVVEALDRILIEGLVQRKYQYQIAQDVNLFLREHLPDVAWGKWRNDPVTRHVITSWRRLLFRQLEGRVPTVHECGEGERFPEVREVVLLRPYVGMDESEIAELAERMRGVGVFLLVMPRHEDLISTRYRSAVYPRIYPRDEVLLMGDTGVYRTEEARMVVKILGDRMGLIRGVEDFQRNRITMWKLGVDDFGGDRRGSPTPAGRREIIVDIRGGHVLYLPQRRVAYTQVVRGEGYEWDSLNEGSENLTALMGDIGWLVFQIDTAGVGIVDVNGRRQTDIDFLWTVFIGRQGEVVTICCKSLEELIRRQMGQIAHVISPYEIFVVSDREAEEGGLNVSGHASCHVLQPRDVAPTVWEIYSEYSPLPVIEAPTPFLCGTGGGLRCSMTTIPLPAG